METYKSTHGKVYIAAMALIALLMVAAGVLTVLFMPGVTGYILLAFYVLVIAAEIWILCSTTYTFGEEELICRSGPFSERIPYGKLRRATKCKGYVFSLALSELRVELKYGRADTDTVFISPENEDEFLEKLSEKCPSMDIYEA